MIDVKDLTLTYASGKGVFNLDFAVSKGEVMGYLGPNGAGKTTTIRALMGFMKPDGGKCSVGGLDCFHSAPVIQKTLGYIPGEISFLDGMEGEEFLSFMQQMRGTRDDRFKNDLIERFELDPRGKIRKFSKGMKQKLGIVAAFMHDPDVLILDEPTSGLDPLMQSRFVSLIHSEKARGKTILMSSHSFEEVEKTCDNVLIIREGRIVNQSDVLSLKKARRKKYVLRAADAEQALGLLAAEGFEVSRENGDALTVFVAGEDVDRFIKTAARLALTDFDAVPQTLEDVFMQFYGKEGQSK